MEHEAPRAHGVRQEDNVTLLILLSYSAHAGLSSSSTNPQEAFTTALHGYRTECTFHIDTI